MAEIHLENVSRIFPSGVVAVERLNLTVQDGEILALVGPSGSGKSTILRLIAGLDSPTSGTIRIGGREVATVSACDRNVALVFQRVALFPHKTVFDNLAFGRRLRDKSGGWRNWLGAKFVRNHSGNGKKSLELCVHEAADLVGIRALLKRYPGQLSGGEQQRVALARSLASEPQALLLDEPLSHLDPALRSELRDGLKSLHRRKGLTTVVVTHDQAEALALGDRVAVMRDGAIEQIGSPRELYERPKTRFVAGFIGESPMNFAEVEVVSVQAGSGVSVGCISIGGGVIRLPAKVQDALKKTNQKRVVCGVRPDDLVMVGVNTSETFVQLDGVIESVSYQGGRSLVAIRLSQRDGRIEPESVAEGMSWRAFAGREQQFQPGENVRLKFDSQNVHWFDVTTGRNLHVE